METTERIELLKKVASTINHDANGQFLSGKTQRLDLIKELLGETEYQLTEIGLCHLYSKKPISEISEPVTVISSHVDTHREITKPFSEIYAYSRHGLECFSFCIPTKGQMHSNAGLKTRLSTYDKYIEALCMAAGV